MTVDSQINQFQVDNLSYFAVNVTPTKSPGYGKTAGLRRWRKLEKLDQTHPSETPSVTDFRSRSVSRPELVSDSSRAGTPSDLSEMKRRKWKNWFRPRTGVDSPPVVQSQNFRTYRRVSWDQDDALSVSTVRSNSVISRMTVELPGETRTLPRRRGNEARRSNSITSIPRSVPPLKQQMSDPGLRSTTTLTNVKEAPRHVEEETSNSTNKRSTICGSELTRSSDTLTSSRSRTRPRNHSYDCCCLRCTTKALISYESWYRVSVGQEDSTSFKKFIVTAQKIYKQSDNQPIRLTGSTDQRMTTIESPGFEVFPDAIGAVARDALIFMEKPLEKNDECSVGISWSDSTKKVGSSELKRLNATMLRIKLPGVYSAIDLTVEVSVSVNEISVGARKLKYICPLTDLKDILRNAPERLELISALIQSELSSRDDLVQVVTRLAHSGDGLHLLPHPNGVYAVSNTTCLISPTEEDDSDHYQIPRPIDHYQIPRPIDMTYLDVRSSAVSCPIAVEALVRPLATTRTAPVLSLPSSHCSTSTTLVASLALSDQDQHATSSGSCSQSPSVTPDSGISETQIASREVKYYTPPGIATDLSSQSPPLRLLCQTVQLTPLREKPRLRLSTFGK